MGRRAVARSSRRMPSAARRGRSSPRGARGRAASPPGQRRAARRRWWRRARRPSRRTRELCGRRANTRQRLRPQPQGPRRGGRHGPSCRAGSRRAGVAPRARAGLPSSSSLVAPGRGPWRLPWRGGRRILLQDQCWSSPCLLVSSCASASSEEEYSYYPGARGAAPRGSPRGRVGTGASRGPRATEHRVSRGTRRRRGPALWRTRRARRSRTCRGTRRTRPRIAHTRRGPRHLRSS
mmetsp:Transcript_3164/g.12090  ORF Transcript_3164/g.12090 Transcript_3164/m.12090 type:complete len:236 (-) Transcript_3164:677-1384(-)